MKVYLLQHSYDERDYEDTKIIGIYSSEEEAKRAIERVVDLPRFNKCPDKFHIDEYNINEDFWTTGFDFEQLTSIINFRNSVQSRYILSS